VSGVAFWCRTRLRTGGVAVRHRSSLVSLSSRPDAHGRNLVQIVAAITLRLCLIAFGKHASLAELILVNTAVSLSAGLLPVPGGTGLSEAALTDGLVALGGPESPALATALTYRLGTLLPAVDLGWFAMWALKQRGYP
jgi:hypothetical protein